MADCCENSLDVSTLQQQQRRMLVTVLVINVLTFVMMVTASRLSGSSSLLSGALDNLGDALTYALSFAVVGATVTAKARVAVFKGLMISMAALAVAGQIVWRLAHLDMPAVDTMGIAALANLAANLLCLRLLHSYRQADVNMSSAYECSRNDVFEGVAVLATTFAVWLFESGWPDVVIAMVLVVLFARSATRVLRRAWRELYTPVPQN